MGNFKIVAVIVLYFPRLIDLNHSLNLLLPQVDQIILIDNTPELNSLDFNFLNNMEFNKVHLYSLGDNMGIAYAQNIGIEWAFDNNGDFILFLDQDSYPDINMVDKLISEFIRIKAYSSNVKIAGVGPVHIDSRNGVKSFFIMNKCGFPNRIYLDDLSDSKELYSTLFLISSGMLVSRDCILAVGGKRSNYFIDHVDTEWCLRARSSGFQLFGVRDAFLYHSIGDKVKKIGFLSSRNLYSHQPIRNYYAFRNSIFLLLDNDFSLFYFFFHITRLIQIFFYILLFNSNKFHRLHMMFLGLYHGFFKIDGKFISASAGCKSIPISKFDP